MSSSLLSCVRVRGAFRAQQSSREAESEERFRIRGGGHLEAASLEQQTHPGLRGQPDSIQKRTHQIRQRKHDDDPDFCTDPCSVAQGCVVVVVDDDDDDDEY